MSETASIQTEELVTQLCELAGVAPPRQDELELSQAASGLLSSFQVGAVAQATIAVAALLAARLYAERSASRQRVRVSRAAAERECTGYFTLDGATPDAWEKFSGLYATRDGHLRIHANFPHHRDGVLALLGLHKGCEREDLARALANIDGEAFETKAMQAGLAVAFARSFAAWDATAQGAWSAGEPLFKISRIGDAPAQTLPAITAEQRPLKGVRVIDLTRILAGPISTRTLAAYGADVMLVNSPNLPNIPHIADTSRGKRSVHLDLLLESDRARLLALTRQARVFVQGYRPGGLSGLGFSPQGLAEQVPGLVYVSLSAYGWGGPWQAYRGFDSLVQTAAGFNLAEASAFAEDAPRPLPVQILDYASGFLMAFLAQVCLLRQQTEGGSWHAEVSLLQTARWLRSLGQTAPEPLELSAHLQDFPSAFGQLAGIPHAAEFERTPAAWRRMSGPPGYDEPAW